MTDKVQKIRKEVERLKSLIGNNSFLSDYEKGCNDGREDMCDELISIIDSLQEEPVSIDFEQELYKAFGQVKDFTLGMRIAKWFYDMGKKSREPVSEDLEQASKEWLKPQLDKSYADYGETKMMELTHFDGYAMLDAIEFGAQWQKAKDESCSMELGEYINELSKQFPEVSFAKLSRIAVRVVKWQKENLWKPADDDDLPEIDKEVIALTQPYPNDEHLRVVFAHRPNKYAKVWNPDLGEEQVVETERHDKGGWNIPNIKYWLDVKLPKEIEL